MWRCPCSLTLVTVNAEVGDEAEAARALPLTDLGGDAAHLFDAVRPELGLGAMLSRHRQQHDRRPAEQVANDDDLIILIEDLGGLFARNDAAEHTVGGTFHGGSLILQAPDHATRPHTPRETRPCHA